MSHTSPNLDTADAIVHAAETRVTKRSIVLNLNSESGRELAKRLAGAGVDFDLVAFVAEDDALELEVES